MFMQAVLNATDVRNEWGSFIDTVVRVRPQFVKRNRDLFTAISLEHLDVILTGYRFNMTYEKEDDGSYSGSLDVFDVVANAPTLDELKVALAQEAVEYAREYMEEFQLYYNSRNRRYHAPYVLRVIIQPDINGVVRLIDA